MTDLYKIQNLQQRVNDLSSLIEVSIIINAATDLDELIQLVLEKAQAVITAQKEKEVAETNAAKLLAVEQLAKETAMTKASKQLEVAKLEKAAAQENADARKTLADAKKYEIEQAGGLSEELKAILENNIAVAKTTSENLSKIQVPQNVFIAGQGGEGQDDGRQRKTGIREFQSDGWRSQDNVAHVFRGRRSQASSCHYPGSGRRVRDFRLRLSVSSRRR